MLFDPDMISWRERGPGQASLRTLPGLTQSPSPPLAHPPPAQAQLPSAPVLQDGQPPPGPDVPRGRSAGVRGGPGRRGRGCIPLGCVSRDLGGTPPSPTPRHDVPAWPRLLGFWRALGSHVSALTALLPAALRGPPPTRGGRAQGQSQQRLAKESSKLRQVSRQMSS